MATKTVSKNYDIYEGTNGKDIIKITAKKSARVYAMSGNDTITVAKGKDHWVYGDDGNDTIIVKKDSGFYVLSGLKGNDKITVQDGAKPGMASDYSSVYGGLGKDTITVTNKKGRYYIDQVSPTLRSWANNDLWPVRNQVAQ